VVAKIAGVATSTIDIVMPARFKSVFPDADKAR
jgi:hypothetical protein